MECYKSVFNNRGEKEQLLHFFFSLSMFFAGWPFNSCLSSAMKIDQLETVQGIQRPKKHSFMFEQEEDQRTFNCTQRWFPPKYIENSFQAIQSTFRLEMHSKQRYKICSVIVGELESFRNYKGFSIIFPKILDTVELFTKVRIVLIPLSITFLNPRSSGFFFLPELG